MHAIWLYASGGLTFALAPVGPSIYAYRLLEGWPRQVLGSMGL